MYEITKDNYKDLKFDGIVVRVPNKVLQNPYDNISFIFECAYYSNSKHGYPKKGYKPDESSFYSAWYNDDYLPRGLMFNSTSRFTLDDTFRYWDVYNHYKFKDMEEFCTWYLQQKGREIWIDDGENKRLVHNIEAEVEKNQNKEWIHEKCGTNTPPTSVPEHPSKGNTKKSFSEIEEQKMAKITETCLKDLIRADLKEQIQKDKFKELHKINSESIYWDIYCDEETTPEMKEKIEEIYPYFKEHYAKSIKQHNGEELKDIYTEDEIREKVNPGWNTRKNKYSDILEYIEMRLDLMQASNNLSESTNYQEQQKYQYIIEHNQKKIDKWLNEKVY